jgi:hypothetical protein
MTGLLAEANEKIKHETGKDRLENRSGKLSLLDVWTRKYVASAWPAAERKEKQTVAFLDLSSP